MKISVIILTHQRLEKLKKCLESIFLQTFSNYEIIIMDDSVDNETDKYINEIDNKKIIYEHNCEKNDIGEKRRMAYMKVSGDIILFVDDDDYYTDYYYFSKVEKIFSEQADIDIILSDTRLFYEGKNKNIPFKVNIPTIISAKKYINGFGGKYRKPTSTLGFSARKSTLDKSKFCNMHMMNDTSIYLRSLINAKNIYHIDEPIGDYRIHSGNFVHTVSADFIVENLKEKKRIFLEGKKMINYPKKIWLNKQIMYTVLYYAEGSKNDYCGRKKVLKYLANQVGIISYIIAKIAFWRNK